MTVNGDNKKEKPGISAGGCIRAMLNYFSTLWKIPIWENKYPSYLSSQEDGRTNLSLLFMVRFIKSSKLIYLNSFVFTLCLLNIICSFKLRKQIIFNNSTNLSIFPHKEKGLSFKQIYNRRLKDQKPVIEDFLAWIKQVILEVTAN